MEDKMKIEIADSDFPRLQAIAQPFVDTPASVITRLLDLYENGIAAKPATERFPDIKRHSLEKLPPLTHTKVMDGHFDGAKPSKFNWDGFVRHALIQALGASGSIDGLRRASGANIKEGKFEDQGYKFVPSHNFSFQGVSAEDAAKIIGRCARSLKVPFKIEFIWRDKPDAFRPGERGFIEFP
jgi:hypothetical protein